MSLHLKKQEHLNNRCSEVLHYCLTHQIRIRIRYKDGTYFRCFVSETDGIRFYGIGRLKSKYLTPILVDSIILIEVSEKNAFRAVGSIHPTAITIPKNRILFSRIILKLVRFSE